MSYTFENDLSSHLPINSNTNCNTFLSDLSYASTSLDSIKLMCLFHRQNKIKSSKTDTNRHDYDLIDLNSTSGDSKKFMESIGKKIVKSTQIDLKFLLVSQAHFLSKFTLRINLANRFTTGLVFLYTDQMFTQNLTKLPFSISCINNTSNHIKNKSNNLFGLFALLGLLLFYLAYYGYEKIFELRMFNSSRHKGTSLISDDNFLVHVFDLVLFYFLAKSIYNLLKLIESIKLSEYNKEGMCADARTLIRLIEFYEMLGQNLGTFSIMLVPNLLNRYAFAIYTPIRIMIKVNNNKR